MSDGVTRNQFDSNNWEQPSGMDAELFAEEAAGAAMFNRPGGTEFLADPQAGIVYAPRDATNTDRESAALAFAQQVTRDDEWDVSDLDAGHGLFSHLQVMLGDQEIAEQIQELSDRIDGASDEEKQRLFDESDELSRQQNELIIARTQAIAGDGTLTADELADYMLERDTNGDGVLANTESHPAL